VASPPSWAGLLRDPLLERDYVRLCTRPAFFRNRTLAPLVLGGILLLMYGFRGETDSPDQLGLAIHLVFTWLAAVFTGVTAASEAAVAIPTERSTGSLPVLLTVPRSPVRLATGFFLSRVLVALTALVGVLPLEGVALLLGGVSLADLGTTLLCIVSATIYGGAAGLFAGYDAPNHRLALGRTGTLLVSLMILLPVALAAAGMGFYDFKASPRVNLAAPVRPDEWLYLSSLVTVFLSPLGSLAALTFARTGIGMPPFAGPLLTPSRIHLAVLCIAVAGALVSILVTGRRLRADTERATVASRRWNPARWLLGLLGRKGPRDAATVWEEPLLWKESRPPRSPWVRWTLRLAMVAYAGLLCWIWLNPRIRDNLNSRRQVETAFHDVVCSLPAWLFLFATAASCGTLLAEERERNSLDLLRAAPFRARAFFLARFLGIGWRLLPFAAATAPFVILGTWLGTVHPSGVLLWGVGAALVAPFLSLVAFRVGMAATSVRAAQRRVGLVMSVLIGGWLLLLWVLAEGFRASGDVGRVVVAANPFVAVSGPYLLFVKATFGTWRHLAPFGVAATLAATAWAGAAWWLWSRIPADLDRALHGASDP
jgi:hypothetical protein